MLTPSQALTRSFTRSPDLAAAGESRRGREQRRGFRMGGYGFLAEPRLLMELVESPLIFALPNAPPACRGLINLRGALTPVFDIRDRLGLGPRPLHWVLVMGRAPEAAALAVDDLPEQVSASPEQRLERLPEAPAAVAACLQGAYYASDELWFELNHRELFRTIGGD